MKEVSRISKKLDFLNHHFLIGRLHAYGFSKGSLNLIKVSASLSGWSEPVPWVPGFVTRSLTHTQTHTHTHTNIVNKSNVYQIRTTHNLPKQPPEIFRNHYRLKIKIWQRHSSVCMLLSLEHEQILRASTESQFAFC